MAAEPPSLQLTIGIFKDDVQLTSDLPDQPERNHPTSTREFMERVKRDLIGTCVFSLNGSGYKKFVEIANVLSSLLVNDSQYTTFKLSVESDRYRVHTVAKSMNVIRNNLNIKCLELDLHSKLNDDILGKIIDVLGTLDLQKLKLDMGPNIFHVDRLVSSLHKNTSLASVSLSWDYILDRYLRRAELMSQLMTFVPTISTNNYVSQPDLERMSDGLKVGTGVRVLLMGNQSKDDVDILAPALEVNNTLQSLRILPMARVWSGELLASSIFKALKHNTSLIKLETNVSSGDIPSLVDLLSVNDTLEDLTLQFQYRLPTDIDDVLFPVLADSSLIEVRIYDNNYRRVVLPAHIQEAIDRRRHNTLLKNQTMFELMR